MMEAHISRGSLVNLGLGNALQETHFFRGVDLDHKLFPETHPSLPGSELVSRALQSLIYPGHLLGSDPNISLFTLLSNMTA